jgi:Domain of unknown function (DUF4266)
MPSRSLLFCALVAAGLLPGCATVKPYQRAYLNDERMQAGQRPIGQADSHMHTYREGSTGGGGGTSSGGCGCN